MGTTDRVNIPELDENDPTQNVTHKVFPTCNVTIARDLYVPPPFVPSECLKRTNEIAIRFGGSNNMMTLLDGSPEDQTRYLIGLVASSIVVTFFVIVWCMVMLCFKCTGYHRCGFLSGHFIRRTPPAIKSTNTTAVGEHTTIPEHIHVKGHHKHRVEEEEEEEEDGVYMESDYGIAPVPEQALSTMNNKGEEQSLVLNAEPAQRVSFQGCLLGFWSSSKAADFRVKKRKGEIDEEAEGKEEYSEEYKAWLQACRDQETRLFRTRVALCISCLVISLSAILFCYYGDKYIHKSFDSVREGLRSIQRLCQGGIYLIQNFIELQKETEDQMADQYSQLNEGLCPNVKDRFCDSDQICNFTGVPSPYVEEKLENIYTFLYSSRTFVLGELQKYQGELQDMSDQIDNFITGQTGLEWAFWVSFGFCIALIMCCLTIIFGIYLLHQHRLTKCHEFFRHQVMFPLFIFLVLLAFVFGIVFIIAAVGASDWCINSPEPKVTYLLEEEMDNIDLFAYQHALYYVNRCDPTLLPLQFDDYSTKLVGFLESLAAFTQDIPTVNATAWYTTCGTNVTVLETLGNGFELATCSYATSLEDVNRFFWCRQWSPVYQVFMHEVICYDAQSGLAWVAGSMFTIIVLGFVVLLLRAGAFNIQDEEQFLRDVPKVRVGWFRAAMCTCCKYGREGEDDLKTVSNGGGGVGGGDDAPATLGTIAPIQEEEEDGISGGDRGDDNPPPIDHEASVEAEAEVKEFHVDTDYAKQVVTESQSGAHFPST